MYCASYVCDTPHIGQCTVPRMSVRRPTLVSVLCPRMSVGRPTLYCAPLCDESCIHTVLSLFVLILVLTHGLLSLQIDADSNGFINVSEIGQALELLGYRIPPYQVRDYIRDYDNSISEDKLNFDGFKQVRSHNSPSFSLLTEHQNCYGQTSNYNDSTTKSM